MAIPTRRRLLRAGGAIAGVVGSTGIVGAQRGVDELSVSITETEDPVGAGDFLRLTTDLDNPTDADVRTSLVLVVGEDPEVIERRELTVPAGESRSVRQGFYTYPVPSDTSFPVWVVTDGPRDQTSVSVRGASTLPEFRPDEQVTVTPGTDVLFEAGVLDSDTIQQTIWWLDDSQETSGVGGPWRATYASETGFEYWQHTFDSSGSFDVAAAVVPVDADETFAARWTVDVASGGNAAPTVDDASPATDTVQPQADLEFELTATDPDGELDRVVWWLTQADVILDISDLEGATDTATLTTDSGCHTCQILPWVIATDGTITTADGWTLTERRADDDGQLALSIRTTNDPVTAGDTLEVVVDLENGAEEPIAEDLTLVVGHDPETVDTQAISLGPGESGAATLEFETARVATDQTFPIRVEGPDETVETDVTVVA